MRVFLMAAGITVALCTTTISADDGSAQRTAMNVVADANATPEAVASSLVSPDADIRSPQDPDQQNRRALDAREQRERFGRSAGEEARERRPDPDVMNGGQEAP